MEFICRKRELEILKSQLESGHAAILLYGRRSLGKTWLLRQAMKDLDGEKIHATVQEGERIKRLQKKLARQVKGSRRHALTLHLIRVEYQKMTNCKDDLANKIVAGLVKNRTVVIQDEMLTHWHRGWFAGHVQHSVLGRVKSDLMMRDDVVVLNKAVPSTRFCPHCGKLNSLSLKDSRTQHDLVL